MPRSDGPRSSSRERPGRRRRDADVDLAARHQQRDRAAVQRVDAAERQRDVAGVGVGRSRHVRRVAREQAGNGRVAAREGGVGLGVRIAAGGDQLGEEHTRDERELLAHGQVAEARDGRVVGQRHAGSRGDVLDELLAIRRVGRDHLRHEVQRRDAQRRRETRGHQDVGTALGQIRVEQLARGRDAGGELEVDVAAGEHFEAARAADGDRAGGDAGQAAGVDQVTAGADERGVRRADVLRRQQAGS